MNAVDHQGAQLRPDESEACLETLQAVQDLREVREAYRALEQLLGSIDERTRHVERSQIARLISTLGMRFDQDLQRAETALRMAIAASR